MLNQESGFNLDRLSYSALSDFTTSELSVPVRNRKHEVYAETGKERIPGSTSEVELQEPLKLPICYCHALQICYIHITMIQIDFRTRPSNVATAQMIRNITDDKILAKTTYFFAQNALYTGTI